MKNTCSCRVGGLWLNNCAFYAQLYFKMEKGVAGAIFKQHHPNFQKLHIFWRLINVIIMSFWKNCYCQIYRKCHSVSNPVFLVILEQVYSTEEQLLLKVNFIFCSTFNSQHGKGQTCSSYKFKRWQEICHDIHRDWIVQ